MSPIRKPFPWLALLLGWVVLYSAGMGVTLQRRFDRRYDLGNALYATAARNILRDGFWASHGGVFISAGEIEREGRDFYPSHPPMLAWWMAGWMKCFGVSNTAVRAAPLAITMLNLLLVYALVGRVLGRPTGILAAALYSILPMTAFFAQSTDMEPWCMTAMLAASLAYLAWCSRRRKRSLTAMLLCLAAGCWTDWPVAIFCGTLAAVHLAFFVHAQPEEYFRRRWKARAGVAAAIVAVPVIMFILFVAYLHINGDGLSTAVERAKGRIRISSLSQNDIEMSDGPTARPGAVVVGPLDARPGWKILLDQTTTPTVLRRWFVSLFTPSALLLALAGAIGWRWWSPVLARGGGPVAGDEFAVCRRALGRSLLAVFLAQCFYSVIFAEGAAIHEFWQYFLIYPVAVLSAGVVAGCWKMWAEERRRLILAGAVPAFFLLLATPCLSWGPFAWRMRPFGDVVLAESEYGDMRLGYIEPLRTYTKPRDVILTRIANLRFSLAWYADRMIVSDEPLFTLAMVEAQADRFAGHRVLYLCEPEAPPELIEALQAKYPRYQAGSLFFFLLRGQAESTWIPGMTAAWDTSRTVRDAARAAWRGTVNRGP